MVCNNALSHVMFKINFTFEEAHDASVSLSGVEYLELLSHEHIEFVLDIGVVKICINLKVVSNFVNFSSSEF